MLQKYFSTNAVNSDTLKSINTVQNSHLLISERVSDVSVNNSQKDINRILNKLDNFTVRLDRNEKIEVSGRFEQNGDDLTAIFNKNLRRKARRF